MLPGVGGPGRHDSRKAQAEQAEEAEARFRKQFRAPIEGRTVVRKGKRLLIVEPRPDITPLQARAEMLDLVTGALTQAGIDHFVLRTRNAFESAVAVPEPDRTRALAVLESACTAAAVYVDAEPAVKGSPAELGPEAWAGHADAALVRVFRHYGVSADLTLGRRYGCVVEFWRVEDDQLHAPRSNRVTASLPVDGEQVEAPERVFTQFAPASATTTRRSRADLLGTLMDEIDFPVDAVYTWVDGLDPAWAEQRKAVLAKADAAALNELAANDSRYLDRQELRYSLRSLALYAPWIRRVWLVTAGQVPAWLDTTNPMLTVVDHKQIFKDPAALPTFNSHAIESQLHHIDGLAEHFLYFNDDVLLGRPVVPGAFFHANGATKFFMSLAAQIPPGERAVNDTPITAATKNTRRLIKELSGRTVTQKLQHVPFPLRRSLLAALEAEYSAEFAATAARPFRHPADISVPANLYHYYNFVKGLSVPGKVAYTYTDLADPATPDILEELLVKRDQDVVCLNDTGSDPADHARQNEMAASFFERYFPAPGPFELPG